ncbi:MAG: MraY family glycosyltransferase, partial [Planctomycetota bacterium]|nr:MraY family glycosyltransferase [Planctomycetota bacterium]
QDNWWVGVVALLASLAATPIMRLIAYRTKLVDRPNFDKFGLKPHARPVAYLGGVAMCFGLLAGLAGYAAVMPNRVSNWNNLCEALASGRFVLLMRNPLWNLMAIALASVLITIVGLLDDALEIKPRVKVLGQVSAAAVLLAGGVGHGMAGMFLRHLHISMPPVWVLTSLSFLICIIMVIAACNATNLLDGLDGLCGGVTGIVALGFLALAVYLATYGHFEDDADPLRVGLSLAMAGAVLGFLPYNIPPASIFMGDAGSMLLGFFVATMMALFCTEGHARFFVAACAVFALPILDTALAVVRRVLAGRNIFTGDRSHLYDQLVDRGMTVKQVVGLFYVLAAATALMGVLAAIMLRGRQAVAIYAILLVVIWTIFYVLGMITPSPRGPKLPDKDAGSEDR